MMKNRKYSKHLDNIKIRTKMIIIYVICVLLPLIATNFFVLLSVMQHMETRQLDEVKGTGMRVENMMNELIEQSLTVSEYIYIDGNINRFISMEYPTVMDYHENMKQHDQRIRYYYSTRYIYNSTLYADNNSILNGSSFSKLSQVEEETWYQIVKENEKTVQLIPYYDNHNEYNNYLGRKRYLSLIRSLDYFGEQHILKLDLDYQMLVKNLDRENSNVYIYNADKIIYNTKEKDRNQAFESIENIVPEDVLYEQTMYILGEQWNIMVTQAKYSLITGLSEFRVMIVMLFIVNLLLPSGVIILMSRSFRKRIMLTEHHIQKMKYGQYETISCYEGRDEIGNLILSYNLMVERIRELIETVYRKNVEQQALELSRKQAELNALQSQMNPHFIFNVLESVRMKSLMKQEYETAGIIEKLAELFRVVIQWNKDFVTIEEELKHVRKYLDIQKYRFGDRLDFTIHIEDSCRKRKIPKFGILTFVENACVHGIAQSIKGGNITICISKDEKQLYLEIMDSGNGIGKLELDRLKQCIETASIEDVQGSQSIGILNTIVRLKLYYQGSMQVNIESTKGEGTEVCVVLPLVYNENLKNN